MECPYILTQSQYFSREYCCLLKVFPFFSATEKKDIIYFVCSSTTETENPSPKVCRQHHSPVGSLIRNPHDLGHTVSACLPSRGSDATRQIKGVKKVKSLELCDLREASEWQTAEGEEVKERCQKRARADATDTARPRLIISGCNELKS